MSFYPFDLCVSGRETDFFMDEPAFYCSGSVLLFRIALVVFVHRRRKLYVRALAVPKIRSPSGAGAAAAGCLVRSLQS